MSGAQRTSHRHIMPLAQGRTPRGDSDGRLLLAIPQISTRDRRTLEIRTLLPLPHAQDGQARYETDLYFFFPANVGVRPETWSVDNFYHNMTAFLRLRAADIHLATLADLNHGANPLMRLGHALDRLWRGDVVASAAWLSLSQMAGTEISDAIYREAESLLQGVGNKDWASRVERFAQDGLGAVLELARVRRRVLVHVGILPSKALDLLTFALEYTCAVLAEVLATVGQTLDRNHRLRDGHGGAAALRLLLTQILERLQELQDAQGFVRPDKSQGERYGYRMGLLKKELQRSSYIIATDLGRDPFLANTAAMVAAGLAATWATLAQIPLITGNLAGPHGAMIFSAAVGAYVLKDRIKDWVKTRLSQRWLRWDRNNQVADGALEHLGLGLLSGRAREQARWLDSEALPKEVIRLRQAQRTVAQTSLELEHVLRYQRQLDLSQEAASQRGYKGRISSEQKDETACSERVFGVQEIVRLSLSDILRRLDEPEEEVTFYKRTRSVFATQTVPKVYHLNVVARVADRSSGSVFASRTRVVINQQGILRLETAEVEAGRSEGGFDED